jgi:hypothetical protein
MIGHLYRYPHPHDPTRFIYVGQGAKRDQQHRLGKAGFGKRFKKLFPGVELTQPIRETVEVENYLELNELETIWMFQYHTWRGYPDGMNLTFPGSDDYKVIGRIAGCIAVESGRIQMLGRIQGRKNVESGQLASIASMGSHIGGRIGGRATVASHGSQMGNGGRIQGRKNVESGQLARIRELPQSKEAQCTAGRISGRKNVESGHLRRISSAGGKVSGATVGRRNAESGRMREVQKMGLGKGGKIGGPIANHNRWHVRRNIVSPTCSLCQQS